MKKLISLSFLYMLFLNSAQAQQKFGEVTNIGNIGPHYPILIVEKNRNPQNIIVVYTMLDAKCNIVRPDSKHPIFDFYWLINGSTYKVVNPLIKSEVQKRMKIQDPSSTDAQNTFFVEVGDLKELKTDIQDIRLAVFATAHPTGCSVDAYLTLGPSNGNAVVRVNSIYAEATGLLQPRVVSVTIKGVVEKTGRAISRTYRGK